MIYISVDNDHHGDLALSLIKKLGLEKSDVTFISHVSRRNNIVPSSVYPRVVIDGHPLSSGSGYKRLVSYINSIRSQLLLKKAFNFTSSDTLLVLTEYQLNNALLARDMKRAGGDVYIFDEGISFYLNNSLFYEKHTTFVDRFYLKLYNLAFFALNIPAYTKKGFDGRMFVCIKDQYIDLIFSRMNLPVGRPGVIRGYQNFLAGELSHQQKNKNAVLFFANNLESFGLKHEEETLSKNALVHMASVFSEVYIKVHPADVVEKNDTFWLYKNLTVQYPNIYLVEESVTMNDALACIKPSVVVGSLGASIFDALFFGCQPVFLFHLLPEVPEFGVCRYTLGSMGYQYIENLADISPDYQCGVDISRLLYKDNDAFDWAMTKARPS